MLHTAEALEPPVDPVLEQVRGALSAAGHAASLLAVGSEVEPVVAGLRAAAPDLVFNLAESFGGKSALESNVAARSASRSTKARTTIVDSPVQ